MSNIKGGLLEGEHGHLRKYYVGIKNGALVQYLTTRT